MAPTADVKKKRVAIYGKTKAEVRAKLTRAVAERDAGVVLETQNPTIEKHLTRWLKNSVKMSVKQKTYESYEYLVHKHLITTLGAKKLKSLTPDQVQDFYQWKLDEGLSRRTVQLIHTTLSKALKSAVKQGIAPRNVAEAVDAPRPQKKDIQPLTSQQTKIFLNTVKGNRLEALYILAITTGLRQGELLGLRWEDVDLEGSVVRVRQQLTRTKAGLSFTSPKNGRGRNVALMESTAEALREHRKMQTDERQKMGNLCEDMGLVFASTVGTPLHVRNITYRSFRPLLKQAGLSQIRFHDLRHTFATLCLTSGTHPKIVQEMLGHSDISVTLNVYSHCLPNMQGKAVKTIEEDLF